MEESEKNVEKASGKEKEKMKRIFILNWTNVRSALFFLCGILLGSIFVFAVGFKTNTNREKNMIMDRGVFGDIKICTEVTKNNKNALAIYKNDNPFIFIYKDSSGKVKNWAIVNGAKEILAISEFEDDNISVLGIYGNKVHDEKRMPIFILKASKKSDEWGNSKYVPSRKAISENGKVKTYKAIGELYEDIDVNGQFDVKRIYDKSSEIISESIFVDGRWLQLAWRNHGEKRWRKPGLYKADELCAIDIVGNQKVFYDFEFGKGWKKRPE